MKIIGIDVYNGTGSNGPIDWEKVKKGGVQFAILKASFGSPHPDQVDYSFHRNVAGAKAAGIPIGAYHFIYARDVETAKKEAQFFLDTIKDYKFEYPVCLDLEDDRGSLDGVGVQQLTDIAKAWMETVESAGYYVMLYASSSWLKSRVDREQLKDYDVWMACYDGNTPDSVDYSNECGIWQYSSTGRVDGIINRTVDMNVAYKDYPEIIKAAGLNGYQKTSSTPAPAPAPTPTEPYGPSPSLEWDYQYDAQIVDLQRVLSGKGHGLITDGLAGPNTYAACLDHNISPNDAGPLTKWTQQRLNTMGFFCGEADGIAGNKTMAGITAFQRRYGLGVGYLGGTDWYYLIR